MDFALLSELCDVISPADRDITVIDPLTSLENIPEHEKNKYILCRLAYSVAYRNMKLSGEMPAVYIKKDRFKQEQQIQINDILLSTNTNLIQLVGVVEELSDLPIYPANDTFIIRPKSENMIEPLLMYFKSDSYKNHFSNTRSEGEHRSMTLRNLRSAPIPEISQEAAKDFRAARIAFAARPCEKTYLPVLKIVSLAVDKKGKAPINRRQYLLLKHELEGLNPKEETELLQLQNRHEKFLAKRGTLQRDRIEQFSADVMEDIRFRLSPENVRKEAKENAAHGITYVNEKAKVVYR